ncbi:dynein light chain LC8-type [Paragonimus westermani]|uniref:Dynein light chain n=1 Tax=Paragonimus westermani TaxID=34504 RepID=A0A5J4NCU0_9TREM|nr:dynein light chain LC8-type [Paragonimus westermani]
MKPELVGSVVKKTAEILNFEHEAVELCLTAMNQSKMEKDMAMFIKKEFDKRHGGDWHCIIGKHFGCKRHVVSFNYLRLLLPISACKCCCMTHFPLDASSVMCTITPESLPPVYHLLIRK